MQRRHETNGHFWWHEREQYGTWVVLRRQRRT